MYFIISSWYFDTILLRSRTHSNWNSELTYLLIAFRLLSWKYSPFNLLIDLDIYFWYNLLLVPGILISIGRPTQVDLQMQCLQFLRYYLLLLRRYIYRSEFNCDFLCLRVSSISTSCYTCHYLFDTFQFSFKFYELTKPQPVYFNYSLRSSATVTSHDIPATTLIPIIVSW